MTFQKWLRILIFNFIFKIKCILGLPNQSLLEALVNLVGCVTIVLTPNELAHIHRGHRIVLLVVIGEAFGGTGAVHLAVHIVAMRSVHEASYEALDVLRGHVGEIGILETLQLLQANGVRSHARLDVRFGGDQMAVFGLKKSIL